MPLFWISLLVLLGSLAAFIEVVVGIKKIKNLGDIQPSPEINPVKVSVLFSALDEAETIDPALRSLLSLDYPNLEIIAINDRSTDATGTLLDRLAQSDARLRVIHVHDLPPGWLGKNHALHLGAQLASGDFLLLTDADVVFEPSAIRRAIAHCEQHNLDHMTVFPELPVKEPLLAMILLCGYFGLFLRWKPWKVRTSPSHYVGIGAFNLIRSHAYREMGGHQAIRLEVLDDMMLGRLVKQKGFSQDALFGLGVVSVEWYKSTREMLKGMQKNSFAIVDYQLGRLLVVTALALPHLWPWIGLLITSDLVWWLNFATAIATLTFYFHLLRPLAWSRLCLFYAPFAGVISLGTLWTGCVLTLKRGGIDWRGTRYSLDELKRAHEK
ncbi:MAG: glycosyltransferase [Betaproteobacteria bacterium]|nr:glycosyltransferase [Betaproteobacteria bacterium]